MHIGHEVDMSEVVGNVCVSMCVCGGGGGGGGDCSCAFATSQHV